MLTIMKFDGLYFHVKIGNFSTISGMTQKEIKQARAKYKFKLIFDCPKACKKFNMKS
jgi:hypothetical protein